MSEKIEAPFRMKCDILAKVGEKGRQREKLDDM
jgi:hypothetical protein